MSLPPSGPDGAVAINPAREFLFRACIALWAITPGSFISKDLLTTRWGDESWAAIRLAISNTILSTCPVWIRR